MQRKTFIKNAALAGTLLYFSSLKSFAKLMEKAGYTIKMLHSNIGIFSEKGGTILFHYSKKGIVVVDSQFPDTVQHLMEELKKLSDKPYQYLINTHHHGDHTGGNIAFKDLVKNVVAHENSAINQKANAIKQKSEAKQLYPTEVFKDTWSRKFGKEKIKLHYFGPAHTNGDIAVHFTKANIVHIGDLMFNRRYPFIDKSSGANIKSWITVLQKIQSGFDDKAVFVFGHANEKYPVTGNKSDLKAFETFLQQLLTFVQEQVNAGKTKEEILKAKTIPGNTEWTGDGIERGLTAAYAEIVEGK